MSDRTAGGVAARIAVCCASEAYGRRLAGYLECSEDLKVVGVCDSPHTLLGLLRATHPDVAVIELDLPRADSVELTRRIAQERLCRVVLVAPHAERQSGRALAGLEAGALEVLSRAGLDLSTPAGPAAHAVRRGIKRLSIGRPRVARTTPPPARGSPRTDVIGVCASTGGPPVLGAVLGRLPRGFAIPVLIVQHMTLGFTNGLVSWLDCTVAVPVALARRGAPLHPGIWFAPDGSDLVLDDGGRLGLDAESPAGAHRPSGDALLLSLARVAGSHAAAVVLTGMGADGAAGLAAVAAAGGRTIAQDEDTCAVYGMPKVAAELGAAAVLAPAAIGDALAAMDSRAER